MEENNMGYGVAQPGYWVHRKNPKAKTLTWCYSMKGSHPKLPDQFKVWQAKAGVTFELVALPADADFVVAIPEGGGSLSMWSFEKKTLFLKGKEAEGAILHEIGHLLGLSHEQDRPDARESWYEKNPGALGKATSLEGARIREEGGKASGMKLVAYNDYDPASIMHYPASNYEGKKEPSPGDCITAKAINGWT
jgi:hypothetical protein